MINYLNTILNPQINHIKIFEVLRDFRKGGLSPENYEEFLKTIDKLPPLYRIQLSDFKIFDHLHLKDITEEEFQAIRKEVMRRGIEDSKFCWHPDAGETCKKDKKGKIQISAAHSIQKNGVLSKIVENGHVMGYAYDKGEIDGQKLGKHHASIFWGFCNTHDSIFTPIEQKDYTKTDEQNFLFAYRGFVVASHKKMEVSTWINYGEQSDNDIKRNREIFDNAIKSKNYSVIKTEVFELPKFYPVAISSAFYLDFDFYGNPIFHSEERMEDIFITLYPTEDKTYFLLSYFIEDESLYGDLGNQLRTRSNLKSDITMLVAAHTENVYFNPTYYDKNIRKQEDRLHKLMMQTQFDYGNVNADNNIEIIHSFTPRYYLNNSFNINFFFD